MNSNEDKLYIKIVDPDALYNFVVTKFSMWNWLESQNIVSKMDFEIWNFQTTSNVDMARTKVVVLNTIHNFVVDFFIWSHLESQICVVSS
jgi:hypothetical protein